jgi:sterol desaturase/sphingolipid hydroxylase (fatty acid hydroxylase superfamily)
MTDIIENEAQIRLLAFSGIFLVMALWEAWRPFRRLRFSRLQRWPHQLGLIVLNSLVLRLLFPAAATGIAISVEHNGWGILQAVPLPSWLAVVMGFVLLDLVIYWQHVFAHRIDWFWKLHRTHHADTDYDLTTGLRFHPLEIIISMLIKALAIFVLGVPVLAVLVFEIILSGSAMFNHSNVDLPPRIDRVLRRLIVTPAMHRVHHSVHRIEHDMNYGFFLSLWDRWFGSYLAATCDDPRSMPIGLNRFREADNVRLDRLLMIPWRQQP